MSFSLAELTNRPVGGSADLRAYAPFSLLCCFTSLETRRPTLVGRSRSLVECRLPLYVLGVVMVKIAEAGADLPRFLTGRP